MASLGEIDIQLTRGPVKARLRALVMENLQADCFGGTTFHFDNDVQPRIKSRQIKLHNKYVINQTNEHLPLPTQSPSVATITTIQTDIPIQKRPDHTFLKLNRLSPLYPNESINIPFNDKLLPSPDIVAVQPLENLANWQPQICKVEGNSIVYTNNSKDVIIGDRTSKFLCLPATLDSNRPTPQSQNKPLSPMSGPNMPCNDKQDLDHSLTPRIQELHDKYSSVFDSNINEPYNGNAGKFSLSLNFKTEKKPESKICPVPLYNHKSADLQQQVMDKLEEQGVLVDPSNHDIQVKKISPSFILQKGRAKHKKLEDCSIDEIRWVVGFNSLNDDLLPKPSKSTSSRNILTFLAKHRFHIHADLLNSYFQIPVRKKDWQWLGVRTPFKGIRVLTRAGQGLLNSESELDELLARVLGQELQDGICYVERDDIIVGGESHQQALDNWERVLDKLNHNNLKLSPKKVKYFPSDIEVFGMRIKNGQALPSDHVLTSLGKSSIQQLKTVKQLNSWKGLYKTLLSSLPNLANVMSPFDQAVTNKSSRDPISWTPQLISDFNIAMKHLDNVSKLTLPKPEEQLILMPDGARVPGGIGWALFVQRIVDNKPTLLPVQFYSAKIKDYMAKWLPCEVEGVASAMAINACSHWILASTKPTYVTPDCKAVVEAVERMRNGKLSRNPRLQMILISINRRPVTFLHSSAKVGQHAIPDHASRMDITCGSKDCAVERFLSEIPDNIQCMSASVKSLTELFKDSTPCLIAATSSELIDMLANKDHLPLGDKDLWKKVQESDQDLRQVYNLLSTGDSPRKNAARTVKTVFRHASLHDDLIVVKETDQSAFKDFYRIALPKNKVNTVLSIIHLKGNHPTKYQSEKIFLRYFFCPGFKDVLDEFYEHCFLCQSIKKMPSPTIPYRNPDPPSSPGTHMNADIIKRAKQLILVTVDVFSNYVTTALVPSETAADLQTGLIQTITPIRLAHSVTVRVDGAAALKSLAHQQSSSLNELGLHLQVGEPLNKNSNCHVDRIIQELELEISKMVGPQDKINNVHLAKATHAVNQKIRSLGVSSSEILFRREQSSAKPLKTSDKAVHQHNLQQAIANKKKHDSKGDSSSSKQTSPGDIVFLKDNPKKHERRSPYIVSDVQNEMATVKKIISLEKGKSCKVSKTEHRIHQERLFQSGKLADHSRKPVDSEARNEPWNPCASPEDSGSDSDDDLPLTDQVQAQPLSKPLDKSLSFHECQSPPDNEQLIGEEPPESIIDKQIIGRKLMLDRLNSVINDLEKDVEQQDTLLHTRRSLTEASAGSSQRAAKTKAKSKIELYYNMPQIDGCVTPDDSILSPTKSSPKKKLEFPYSFGLDFFMYDEPEYLEAYSVTSCPDLVFPYEYIETAPRDRVRSESLSDSDLPSNHARRLESSTDALFLDL